MPIHSHFLRYFDEVCKNSSIRKAAAKLHVASSAVNRQILKVEDELGTKLFERSHEGIRLTEAGQLLAQHVARTLIDADRTLREIEACENHEESGLKLVAQGSVISRLLPPVLMSLYAEFPHITTSFMATGGRDLGKMLLNGSADIALMFDCAEASGLEIIKQISLPVGAVMAPDHPLAMAGSSQLTMQECAEHRLILPDQSWPLRDRLDRELVHTPVDTAAVTTSNSMEFLRAMLIEKKLLGFQTVVGLEISVKEGSLVHIPLLGRDGNVLTQTFSIGVSENIKHSEALDRTLFLLCERLQAYAVKYASR
ncbi:MAG: LysR family transcriptional regulator [Thiolinea sp.]